MMSCPNCKGIDIGKIADTDYYCWQCFIQITRTKQRINIYEIEADGSLSSLNDLFNKEELIEAWR